jgi:DNA gyrase subunit B
LNNYGKKENIFKDLTPTGDDFREGLTAVISVRVPHPQFEGQTKTKLGNGEVEGIVNRPWAIVWPSTWKRIRGKPRRSSAKACWPPRRARRPARPRTCCASARTCWAAAGLPGKLRDCISKDMESANCTWSRVIRPAAAPKGGRLREFQAILPLRGKIINAYKSREDKVLANEEVQSMIQAIGIGIGEDQDVAKRRYNKIIIMTDADVDGSHIRTLLLCFFYRQMYQLVSQGHVYVAQPPLFRVRGKKETYYVQTKRR